MKNLWDNVSLNEFENMTLRQIQVRLKTKYQKSIGLSEIKSYLTDKGVNFKKENDVGLTLKKSVFESVVDENDQPLISLDNLDFSCYKKLDLNSPNSILSYIQKIQLYLYLKQCEIVVSKINMYQNGTIKRYPTLAVTNLVRLFGLYNAVTGISVYSNQQSAIQSVEAMGFQLDRSLD